MNTRGSTNRSIFSRIHFVTAVACLIAASGGVAPVIAAESSCDPALKAPDAHPFGYKPRGDRCEGVYIQPVSGTTLAVSSFTQGFGEFDLRSGEPLTLTWEPLGDGSVHLRGVSTKRRLYYRMDSVLKGAASTYTWPTNMLAALALSRRDLGVTAWTRRSLGGVQRIVHLPLRINQRQDSKRTPGYQLELIPNRELAEVYVTIIQLDDDGNKSAAIQDAHKLGYGYYPAERAFLIPIPQLPGVGIYHLNVGAVLAGGGSSTVDFWFHYPGI